MTPYSTTESGVVLYRPVGHGKADCLVCPHRCRLGDGQIGLCGARVGSRGTIAPVEPLPFLAHGIGVIEDHPLFHFFPGMRVLSIGTVGCSALCRFCQNWELALAHRFGMPTTVGLETSEFDPIDVALRSGAEAIALTYNEPTIRPELVLRLSVAARQAGLKVVLVTNGYMTPKTLDIIVPHLDAVKLDVKAADDDTYIQMTGLRLAPVLDTLARLRSAGVWHEISTVVVPGVLDNPSAVERVANHIIEHSGTATPWHLMRFFPAFRMLDKPVGDLSVLRGLRHTALALGMSFVYISNIPNLPERDTRCPRCGSLVAMRPLGRQLLLHRFCQTCGAELSGVGLVELDA